MRRWLLALAIPFALLGHPLTLHAAPVFDTEGTTLFGFNAVLVGADSYSIRFVDGSYDVLTAAGTLYGFTSYIDADRASTALLAAFYRLGDLNAQSFKSLGCGGALSTCGYYTVASNLYLQNGLSPVVDVSAFSLEDFALYPASNVIAKTTDLRKR